MENLHTRSMSQSFTLLVALPMARNLFVLNVNGVFKRMNRGAMINLFRLLFQSKVNLFL